MTPSPTPTPTTTRRCTTPSPSSSRRAPRQPTGPVCRSSPWRRPPSPRAPRSPRPTATDLLRSKSLDRNSFDSGDWFNALHWDCRAGNGFGRGLPPAADNRAKWSYAKPLLANAAISPGCAQINGASSAYQDLLTIRATERDFDLSTAGQVQSTLSFPLSGKDETPGVITMRLGKLVVVLNAAPGATTQKVASLAGKNYALHPVQAAGADLTVKRSAYERSSGSFTVPGRTVAVFSLR